MATDGVGRLLVASLHQSIAELLPMRLAFYEHWLNQDGLRDGTVGLPPFLAVLSFLRQEGGVYEEVTARAGRYAAQWMVESMPRVPRSMIGALPSWLLLRAVIGLMGRLVRHSYAGSHARWTVRRGAARIHLGQSIFCGVRQPVAHPLCAFYAAACTRLLSMFGVEMQTDILACRGTGEPTCELAVRPTGLAGLVGLDDRRQPGGAATP